MTQSPRTIAADQLARLGTKKRRVYELLSDLDWHSSSELDAAFRGWYPHGGWCWDGAKAQLKATLERAGGTIESEKIDGRLESRHRMILPVTAEQPDDPDMPVFADEFGEITRRELDAVKARTERVIAKRSVGAVEGKNPGRPSPSRWQDRVGVSGAARATGGEQNTLWEERG